MKEDVENAVSLIIRENP